MKHILLDVNIIVDLCVTRAGSTNSRLAISLAEKSGSNCWVYAGSVQTLEYVVADELLRKAVDDGTTNSKAKIQARARLLLAEHTANFQWLAALASEGNVFGSDDPEDEQLMLALELNYYWLYQLFSV